MARLDVSTIRRQQIIDAALEVFSEKGYHNTTVADIASELELGHSTIYRYFDSKLDIASSLIEEVIAQATEALSMQPPGSITTVEQYRESLLRIGNRFFDFLGDNPRLHRFLFFEAMQIDETITKKINDAFTLFASFTESQLKNGIKRGFIKPNAHTREASFAIQGMVWEAAKRLSDMPNITEESKSAWSVTIIGLMLDGLKEVSE